MDDYEKVYLSYTTSDGYPLVTNIEMQVSKYWLLEYYAVFINMLSSLKKPYHPCLQIPIPRR